MTTDHNEAMRLAGELVAPIGTQTSYQTAHEAAALLRLLSAERDQLRAEVERLREAISMFCAAHKWAVAAWKAQPAIAPLFEIDADRTKGEAA